MKGIMDPKFWAILSAAMVPVLVVISCLGYRYCDWTFEQSTAFTGAYAGTFAAFSGFLFIYVNFKQQQTQFERQSFESSLHRLLDTQKRIAGEFFPFDPANGLVPSLRKFQESYNNKFILNHIVTVEYSDKHPIEMDDEEKELKLKIIPELFKNAFVNYERPVKENMKSFVGVLEFIELSSVPNKTNYFNLLFSQLTQAEIRTYFYGCFVPDFSHFSEREEKLVKDFFLLYHGKELMYKKDILLAKP